MKLINDLAMFEDDNQDAADDARDELKFQLSILNRALKDLNKNRDFTYIIRPLLADQGPATAFVPKLKKQIKRMTKIKMTSCAERRKTAGRG